MKLFTLALLAALLPPTAGHTAAPGRAMLRGELRRLQAEQEGTLSAYMWIVG